MSSSRPMDLIIIGSFKIVEYPWMVYNISGKLFNKPLRGNIING
jgi:hypothetical protein